MCKGKILKSFTITVPNISSLCKSEEGDDAADTPADDNAADGDIGGAVGSIISVQEHWRRISMNGGSDVQ